MYNFSMKKLQKIHYLPIVMQQEL